MSDEQSDGSGHRARLRKRLFEGGPDALLDHELVEYLLGLAIPRRDTKPLAQQRIRHLAACRAPGAVTSWANICAASPSHGATPSRSPSSSSAISADTARCSPPTQRRSR